ncbi:type VI secretion system Vgr family protein [Sorangium sp. So ce1128]
MMKESAPQRNGIAEAWTRPAMPAHAFEVDGLGHTLHVTRFEGEEGLSRLFRFEITAICETGDIAFGDVVGRRAVLAMCLADTPRFVHGIVERFEQHEEGKEMTAYRAVLVPEVQRLAYGKDSRIFQALSVPEIIDKVLKTAGVAGGALRLALGERHPARDYCVQYRESDWAFLSRLMEAEGIHYFFEHAEEGHVLVIADGAAAHPPIAGEAAIAYRPALGALAAGEHVSRFRYIERVRPGKVTARDYDFKRPSLSLETSQQARDEHEIEDYDFPGGYETPETGAHLAEVRLEEAQCARRTGQGESTSARLVAGRRFRLTDHPRDDLNREYLITSIAHRGSAPSREAPGEDEEAEYANRFEVIPAGVPYRPARRTPRPVIQGVQTAIVVGPRGQSIYTDEHGRVKVQFHWDRQGRGDEQSSCWIRVSQPWAGSGFGAMFLPRVGHEVVVEFLEGDPDRPLITGCLYHGANTPPYALPAHKTRSTVKSSSAGGEGANEIRFEDAAGAEEIFVHAQKDYNEVVNHNRTTRIGVSQTSDVAGSQSEHVGGDQAVSVEGHRTIHVRGSQRVTVGGSAPSGGIQGASMSVTGTYAVDASDKVNVQAPAAIRLECGGSSIVIEPGKITLIAGGGAKLVLEANALVESAAGTRVLLDANALMRASGGAEVLLDANALARSSAGSQVVLDAHALVASAGGSQVLLDANATMSTGAEATVEGATATLSGGTEAVVTGGGSGAVKTHGGGVTASGPKVDVGAGAVNITGGVVKIN